jgi:hypothetical protein
MEKDDDLYPCCMKEYRYGITASHELQTWRTIASGSSASIEERITAIKSVLSSRMLNRRVVCNYPDSLAKSLITIGDALDSILGRYQSECEEREEQKRDYNSMYKLDGSPCPYCNHPHPDVNSL